MRSCPTLDLFVVPPCRQPDLWGYQFLQAEAHGRYKNTVPCGVVCEGHTVVMCVASCPTGINGFMSWGVQGFLESTPFAVIPVLFVGKFAHPGVFKEICVEKWGLNATVRHVAGNT
jgi:hypothetical protein